MNDPRCFLRFLAACLLGGACVSASVADKPNAGFILADDLGYGDSRGYGHPYAKTPNLDKPAEQGTRFTQSSSVGATGCPARTAVMTDKVRAAYKEYPAVFESRASVCAADPPGLQLRAGAAAVEISPNRFPVNMPGGFAENFATKSHDPLHARALVMADGKLTLALVLLDNLGAAQEVIDEIKSLVSRRCDLLPEHILISSTHTHSAPASNVKEGALEAIAYRQVLIDGTVEAIVAAHKALRPASVGVDVHPLPDEVFNRRWFLKPGNMPLNPFGGTDLVRMNPGTSPAVLSHPAGPTDPNVTVLSVNEAKGNRALAVYANYSLHYVGGTPKAEVSADYFGEFARLMPHRVGSPPGFVAMLTNGASGDINNIPFGLSPPRPPREVFEQIRIVAGKTADAAWQARQKITAHRGDVTLDMIQRPLKLRHRRPTNEQLERAKKIVNLKDQAEKDKLPRLADAYAERTVRQSQLADTITVPLQVVRIGDFVICAIPFETFVEIGLDLKKRSPFPRTMVVSIANGYNGYLPTPEQHKLGGYETWLGTNRVQEDASVLITNTLLEMLKELAARSRK